MFTLQTSFITLVLGGGGEGGITIKVPVVYMARYVIVPLTELSAY
jgi:hypothetical protein